MTIEEIPIVMAAATQQTPALYSTTSFVFLSMIINTKEKKGDFSIPLILQIKDLRYRYHRLAVNQSRHLRLMRQNPDQSRQR